MANRIQEEEASSPFWLLTMGDMNNLLMVFFILLFSLLTRDKVKYIKLQEDLKAISMSGDKEGGETPSGKSAAQAFEATAAKKEAESTVRQIRGHYVRLQRLQEGVSLTLGSEPDPFDEGDWTLKKSHRDVLVEVKQYLVGIHKYIEIRGHTSGHPLDSVIVESGPDGQLRVRRFTQADRGESELRIANWSMLAWLRASEVKKFLMEKHPEEGDHIAIPEDRLRIRSDAWIRFLTPSSDVEKPEERAVNHRVEVVLTNEPVRKK